MIAFIDVGQGDGIFLRTTNGTTWLVDGGSSNVNEVGKYRILPFLNYYGEEDVDYACITHSDADHISGIRELLLAKKIRHLVMTEISKTDETSRELGCSCHRKWCGCYLCQSGQLLGKRRLEL